MKFKVFIALGIVFFSGCVDKKIKSVSKASQVQKQLSNEVCSCGGVYELRESSVQNVEIQKEQPCTSHPWGTDLVLNVQRTDLYTCNLCGKTYEKNSDQVVIECHGFDAANAE